MVRLTNKWFADNQPALLCAANDRTGRQLLGINDSLPDIIAVRPDSVTARISKSEYVSEFRASRKYAAIIAGRWGVLEQYLQYAPEIKRGQISSLYYPVPALSLATISEFRSDPDPESTTVDGRVSHNGTNATFSTLVGGAGTDKKPSATDCEIRILAGTTTDRYNFLARYIGLFNTAAIPDSDAISSARLRLYVDGKANGLNGNGSDNSKLVAVSSNPASNTDLVSADYATLGATSFGESVIQSSITNGAYNDILLNATGRAAISKTGISKFGVRYKWDVLNTTTGLTWSSGQLQQVPVRMADYTGTSNDPVLEVTHAVISRPMSIPSLMGRII